MIPAFRIEEHHEEFLIWHYAVRQGILAPSGNALLHVDEHSDWSTPRLTRPLESLGDSLADIAGFTYHELDIGNFIWPAVYQGIFSEVYWLRSRHSIETVSRRMFIRPANEQRTEFVTGIDQGYDTRATVHACLNPDASFESRRNLVLDIDLDYFSSHRFPDYGEKRVEVTRASFEEFRDNPYHFLRIAPGSRITAEEEDGRYYFYFGRFPAANGAGDTGEILRRLDAFIAFLERGTVAPVLIVSARSRHSGYTPSHRWEFIENALWERLEKLYCCDNRDFQELLR